LNREKREGGGDRGRWQKNKKEFKLYLHVKDWKGASPHILSPQKKKPREGGGGKDIGRGGGGRSHTQFRLSSCADGSVHKENAARASIQAGGKKGTGKVKEEEKPHFSSPIVKSQLAEHSVLYEKEESGGNYMWKRRRSGTSPRLRFVLRAKTC